MSQLKDYEKLVPPFTTRPTHATISYQDTIKYEFIVYDTETTATGRNAQICQLHVAAITKSGQYFNQYILPTGNITHCSMHALRTNIMYLGFPVIHCEINSVLLCTMAACLLVVKLCLIRSNLQ